MGAESPIGLEDVSLDLLGGPPGSRLRPPPLRKEGERILLGFDPSPVIPPEFWGGDVVRLAEGLDALEDSRDLFCFGLFVFL